MSFHPACRRATKRNSIAWLLLIVAMLVCTVARPAHAQRNRGRGGNGRLPGALSNIPRAQLGAFDRLLDDVIDYLTKKYPTASVDPGNFFGKVVLRNPPDDAVDATPPIPGQFGYYVLGGLSNDHRRQLLLLTNEQMPMVLEFQGKFKQFFAKFEELKAQARPTRAMELELQKIGEELGELEVRMGLAQARTFAKIRETMTDDQVEYQLLLRRTPDSGSLENPSVVRVREATSRMPDEQVTLLLAFAERCCLYLTGAASQNVPTLSAKQLTDPDSKEAERKQGFLQTLNPPQLQGLANMLSAQLRLQADATAKRLAIAMQLDMLKTAKRLDERKLPAAGGMMGKADAALMAAKLEGLSSLQSNLSAAQKAFITSNILVGAP
ncbi:MAG: hypothetical protein KDB14_29885 [Planctomycetales bacterium]|nr:hypothetical protein [Planctomycetales bacterium]